MSRVAKNPIPVPAGVDIKIDGQNIQTKGTKGVLDFVIHDSISIEKVENELQVKVANAKDENAGALSGTTRAVVNNMVIGVSEGFEKKLLLIGVGYRVQIKGKTVVLTLGKSHDDIYAIPEGVIIEAPSQTEILIKGANKQLVGQVSAEIRAFRPPERYKGKGVRYADEVISLKETKK